MMINSKKIFVYFFSSFYLQCAWIKTRGTVSKAHKWYLPLKKYHSSLVENMNRWTIMLCLIKIEWSLILVSDAFCHNKKTVIQTLYIIVQQSIFPTALIYISGGEPSEEDNQRQVSKDGIIEPPACTWIFISFSSKRVF